MVFFEENQLIHDNAHGTKLKLKIIRGNYSLELQ